MKKVSPKYDVGVIVGRFQVDTLHAGHKRLIESVLAEHKKVIIFLGLSPCRVTRNNPLDFESRKQMILAEYPSVNVLYIKDNVSDQVWSKSLDRQIGDLVGPNSSVVLYGSRESFISHYTTKHYDTIQLEQEVYTSGSEIRDGIGVAVKASPEFRAGVIWAAYNQYPRSIPTVDVAIWDTDKREKLLMARKPDETLYRFVGGFAQGGTYESEARREVMEEAHVEVGDPVYVGSCVIDDWRYRRENDKIVTLLFEAIHMFGRPTPDDDIQELKWFDYLEIKPDDLVPEHRKLLALLRAKYPKP